MDKITQDHILNILRQGTVTWHVRNEVINRGRRRKYVGEYKNGKKKEIWEIYCESCGKWEDLKSHSMEVDHIDPVGGFLGNWDIHINRLFCSPDNLQRLCFVCHSRKTATQNSSLLFTRKKSKLL